MAKDIVYKNFYIHLNQWKEYCVVNPLNDRMLSYNAGFETIRKAKQFINNLHLDMMHERDIEELAAKIK